MKKEMITTSNGVAWAFMFDENNTPVKDVVESLKELMGACDKIEDSESENDYYDCDDEDDEDVVDEDDKILSSEEYKQAVRNELMGKVKNISYNLEMRKVVRDNTETEIPILHTTVYFNDGTFVKVCNSEKDKIEVKKIIPEKDIPEYGQIFKDSAEPVYVASDAAKEQAVTYALFKKMMNPDYEGGEIKGNGYVTDIHRMIDEKAIDQNLKPTLNKLEKEKARINHQKMIDDAKARRIEKIKTGTVLDVLKILTLEELVEFIKSPEQFMSNLNGDSDKLVNRKERFE